MKVTQDMLKTTRDQIVVLVPNLKLETESGITIPQSVLEGRMRDRGLNEFFEVVAVGNEVREVKVGSKVLITRITELPVEANDEEFKVFVGREYDVVAFYEE